jgi:hypothetical protein
MKVVFNPEYKRQRGVDVAVGNVYLGRNDMMRVCLAVAPRDAFDRPWNNVLLVTVNVTGQIISGSMQPERYVSDHMNFVGTVVDMPELAFTFEGRE